MYLAVPGFSCGTQDLCCHVRDLYFILFFLMCQTNTLYTLNLYNVILICQLYLNLKFFLNFLPWLCWVFVAARGLPLVGASRGYSSLQCVGFSFQWLLLLWNTGSR